MNFWGYVHVVCNTWTMFQVLFLHVHVPYIQATVLTNLWWLLDRFRNVWFPQCSDIFSPWLAFVCVWSSWSCCWHYLWTYRKKQTHKWQTTKHISKFKNGDIGMVQDIWGIMQIELLTKFEHAHTKKSIDDGLMIIPMPLFAILSSIKGLRCRRLSFLDWSTSSGCTAAIRISRTILSAHAQHIRERVHCTVCKIHRIQEGSPLSLCK